jgi:small subunit ribosomal protein S1
MNNQTNPNSQNENLEDQNAVESSDLEENTNINLESQEIDTESVADIEPDTSSPAEKEEIEGKVLEDEELDEMESEYTDEEFDAMAKLYEETMSDFSVGQVVVGKVLAVNDKEVSVDIGFKSEGNIPIEEFDDPEDISIGDNIEVFIDDVEDLEGLLVLSKKKADFMKTWDRLIEQYEKGEIIEGKCTRRIKGGIVVDLGGVDAFLPGSQIDVRPIRDFDALIGKTMDFKIVKVNQLRKNIVVSHRVLVEQQLKGQREKILEELEKGQILEGTVKNITDFGVFLDLGGVDGLLHINDLSWGRVSHPSEIVSLDEKIKVVVLDFNEQKDRISLGLKQLQPHPWEDIEEKYPVGSVVRGKVVSISDYGAFVELEKGIEGLIHISEMSWTQHIKHPSKVLAVGEMVEAQVLNIQKEERKISLGLKQLDPDPWETLAEKYPVASLHKGIVRNLTNFGAFVELEEGIDGLIHISDLSWTKKIRHPGEIVKKGEEIDVVVLNVDKENRRISLGYKQTKENPWDYLEKKYKPGEKTEGKVVRLIEKGLIVELPEAVDGFVPLSQLLKDNLSKPADGYKIDDVLDLTVIEFNKDNKKIVLSEKGYTKPEKEEEKSKTDQNEKSSQAEQQESDSTEQKSKAGVDSEEKTDQAQSNNETVESSDNAEETTREKIEPVKEPKTEKQTDDVSAATESNNEVKEPDKEETDDTQDKTE